MMKNIPQLAQFGDLNKVSVETALSFAKISLESAERMMKLQLDAAKNALEENAKNASALLQAKDFNEMTAIRAQIAEQSIEKALSFSRSLYEAASQTQTELSTLVEGRIQEFGKTVTENVETATKGVPAGPGGDFTAAAVKSVVETTAAAVETMTKAAKQVAEFADSNLKTAANMTTEAVKKATETASKGKK